MNGRFKKTMTTKSAADSRWIFGYGSLVWRPDFPSEESAPATILGWKRRFWQGSTDHRGTPQQPGRVVTLRPSEGGRCRGVAYRVERIAWQSVLEQLDVREQGGYERHDVPLELRDGRTVNGLVYVASDLNPNYLGPASDDEIVRQVLSSSGPSGCNVEYVLRLSDALEKLGGADTHVRRIADAVRDALAASRRGAQGAGQSGS